jgi:hypothetical protein
VYSTSDVLRFGCSAIACSPDQLVTMSPREQIFVDCDDASSELCEDGVVKGPPVVVVVVVAPVVDTSTIVRQPPPTSVVSGAVVAHIVT